MLNIVRIIGMNNGGGCRVHCAQLNGILHKQGHACMTFIPKPSFEDPLTSTKLTTTQYVNSISPIKILYYLVKQQHQISYVHLHLKNAIMIYGIACLVLGIPFIATVHQALEFRRPRQFISNFVYAFVLKRARKVIAISAFISDQLLQIGVASISIYNASNEVSIASKSSTKIVKRSKMTVGIVGELSRRKGVQDLPAIAASCPEADFLVFGEGELASLLENIPNVMLQGYQKNIGDIYSRVDVLLVLSFQEPFGRVTTEAFSAGVPVVGRRSGALPEILLNDLLFINSSEVPRILEKFVDPNYQKEVATRQRFLFQNRFAIDIFEAAITRELT